MLYDNFVQFRSRLVGMADEVDSKSVGSNTVRVQVPQPALLGRGESLKSNIVYVIFKAFSFCKQKSRWILELLSSHIGFFYKIIFYSSPLALFTNTANTKSPTQGTILEAMPTLKPAY